LLIFPHQDTKNISYVMVSYYTTSILCLWEFGLKLPVGFLAWVACGILPSYRFDICWHHSDIFLCPLCARWAFWGARWLSFEAVSQEIVVKTIGGQTRSCPPIILTSAGIILKSCCFRWGPVGPLVGPLATFPKQFGSRLDWK